MTATNELDQRLRAHFAARADATMLDGQLEAVIARTTSLGQRPAWLSRIVGSPRTATQGIVRPAPWAVGATLVLMALALLVLAAIVGTHPTPRVPFNGLIVFGRAALGGDPVLHVVRPDGSSDRILSSEPHDAAFWSPDGSRVGFTNGYVDADGRDPQTLPLARGTLLLACWDWSPDGSRCAAEGWNEAAAGRGGVYLLSATDHADPVQLTHGRDLPGAFSPDGTQVAFLRLPNHGQEGRLMVVNVDGSGERRVGDLIVGQQLAWTRDGRSILAAAGGDLVAVDVASGAASRIEPDDDAISAVLGAALSPDGSRILVRRAVDGGAADLFTMRTDGTDVVRLTSTPEDERFMDWGTHPLDP